jgi:predicted alpha/beta superfamily hydrolase
MNRNLLAAIIIILIFTLSVTAQQESNDIVIGKTRIVKSSILGEDRIISVWLPSSYEGSTKSYPVLYLLDGDPGMRFALAAATVEELAGWQIPEMIVVGVANIDRSKDMFPNADGSESGADNFLSFLRDELTPYVDSQYRTFNYQILLGQSNSALFVTYALLKDPESFNAYLASSPMLGSYKELIYKMANSTFGNFPDVNRYLYMNYGDRDYERVLNSMPGFMEILEQKSPKTLEYKLDILPGEGHVPFISYYDALKALFHDYKLTEEIKAAGLDSIIAHYANLSNRYGYEVEVPQAAIMGLGGFHFNRKEYDEAIAAYKKVIEKNPDLFFANYYSAHAYRSKGDLDNALKFFRIAYKLSPTSSTMGPIIEEIEKELAESKDR